MNLLAASAMLAAVLAGTVPMAGAAPFTAAQIMSNFNAVTIGNLSVGNSETQGPVVAGGNLSGAQVNINGSALAPVFAGYGDANAYGNVSLLNANRQTVYAGGTAGGGLSGVALAVSGYTFPDPVSALVQPLLSLSSAFQGMAGTTVTSLPMNNAILSPNTTVAIGGVNVGVINITGAALDGASSFSINPNGAALVVVNVDASGNFAYGGNFNQSAATGYTLFNFYNALNVSLGSWNASILAPQATVSDTTAINGFVFADAISTSGELHMAPLNAVPNLVSASTSAQGASVPEPDSLDLFGISLIGLLGVVSRRFPAMRRDRVWRRFRPQV